MSVVGFDFGHANSVIAVARRGGIDTIANEVSNRLTPSVVSFGQKERYVGEAGYNQLIMNFKNTIGGIQTFLGRQYSEPGVQEALKRLPVATKALPNGEVGFVVQYHGETCTFSATQIAAMILYKLKTITERELGSRMSDVVISCPGYFTDLQRRALLHASEIAGLNCLRLLNETTATALYWGFYRQRDLPENDPIHVMFIDCGYSTTNVSIVDFTKSKLKVVAYAWDNNLGGRTIDEALAAHFNEEFKTKYGIDALSNPRATIRLLQGCEKLKKVLSSGVTESVLNIESLMNDRDVTSRMTKADFEALIQPQLERIGALVHRALEMAGLTAEQISNVEIVGGNKRVPAVQRVLSDILKKELGQTMNDAESVAKGCALQCAMLSPALRVRDYGITDINTYPIKISWHGVDEMQVDNNENSAEIFPANNPVPSSKYVTLTRNTGFEIVAEYNEHPLLPAGHPRHIGRFVMGSIPSPSPEAKENPKIKVKIRLNPNGIFGVESAEFQETIEVEEKPATPAPTETPKADQPAENGKPAEETNGTAEGAQPAPEPAPAASTPSPEANNTANSAEANEAKTSEPAKKRKIRNTPLSIAAHVPTLSKKEIQSLFEEESKMQSQDRLAAETAEAKNAVESYILDMRNRLYGDLQEYSTEEERSAFESALNAAEDWLYDEGDDVTKGVYVEKKKELQKFGDPIVARKTAFEKREANYEELKKTIEHYRSVINDAKYDHIEQAEKDKILALCKETEAWCEDIMAKQRALAKTAPAVLQPQELVTKKEAIEKLANPILAKPKPAPPPPPAPETPAQEAPKAEGTTPEVPMADASSATPEAGKTEDVPMTDAPAADSSSTDAPMSDAPAS